MYYGFDIGGTGCRDIRGVQRAVFGFRHTGYANPYRPFYAKSLVGFLDQFAYGV